MRSDTAHHIRNAFLGILACFAFGCAMPPTTPVEPPEPEPAPSAPVTVPEPRPADRPPPPPREIRPPPPAPQPPPEPTVVRSDNPAAEAAAERLARQLRLDRRQIEVVQVTSANWPDACLGLPAEGEICAMVITPGFSVRLTAAGQRYEFRTDQEGTRIRLASSPVAETGERLLTWRDTGSFAVMAIGVDRVLFGERGSPQLAAPLPDATRERQLITLLGKYSSINAQTTAGEIHLRGVGSTEATSAEKRMIAEWARLVRNEINHGNSAVPAEPALVWRRMEGSSGPCDEIVVSRAGIAVVGACVGDGSDAGQTATLTAVELADFYSFFDRFRSFSWQVESDPAAVDSVLTTIEFRGSGSESFGEEEGEKLVEFVSHLSSRLRSEDAAN